MEFDSKIADDRNFLDIPYCLLVSLWFCTCLKTSKWPCFGHKQIPARCLSPAMKLLQMLNDWVLRRWWDNPSPRDRMRPLHIGKIWHNMIMEKIRSPVVVIGNWMCIHIIQKRIYHLDTVSEERMATDLCQSSLKTPPCIRCFHNSCEGLHFKWKP